MDLGNILQKIIELLIFGDKELSVPQIQINLAVKFGIHIKQNQIIQIINNNKNQFIVIREGNKPKIRYQPRPKGFLPS